jgi:putative DNA primase/helicase
MYEHETKTNYAGAVDELSKFHQWVCWRYGAVRSNGKRAKVPINPITGQVGDALDPELWGSYSDAVVGEVLHGCDGIGFVLTEDDPYCAIDLDDVIDPDTGTINDDAQAIVNSIDAYWEVSPSHTGLRVLLKGTKPGSRSRTTASNGIEVEVYDSKRFVTITGLSIEDCEEVKHQEQALTNLYRWLFGDEANGTVGQDGAGFTGTDAELLSKARNVGQWKMFRKLFDNGNWQEDFPSQSEADLKLATMLAFWCGPDAEGIDRLFRRSELMRPKWDDQRGDKTYGEHTIAKAIANCPYFYRGKVDVSDEVQARLNHLYGWLVAYAWDYRAGPTDRHVYRALLDHASEHGTEHPEGITVSMGSRDLMLEARVGSRHTIDDSLERLIRRGVVEVLRPGRGRRATLFLLKEIAQNCPINNTVYVYGAPLSNRVRNPSQYISTIGKRNAQILDIIHASNTPVPLDTLARLLNIRGRGKYNLKYRNLALLKDLGLIEYVEDGYITPEDFEQRMERELKESGCSQAERLQRERIAREQEAFRTREEHKADKVAHRAKKLVVTKQVPESMWRKDKPIPGDDFLSEESERSRNRILYMFWHEEGCPCKICTREREAERSSLEHWKLTTPRAGDDGGLDAILEELEQLAESA